MSPSFVVSGMAYDITQHWLSYWFGGDLLTSRWLSYLGAQVCKRVLGNMLHCWPTSCLMMRWTNVSRGWSFLSSWKELYIGMGRGLPLWSSRRQFCWPTFHWRRYTFLLRTNCHYRLCSCIQTGHQPPLQGPLHKLYLPRFQAPKPRERLCRHRQPPYPPCSVAETNCLVFRGVHLFK